MKVNFPAKNKIPPLNQILQFQLILELFQRQEILSVYSDFLLFFAKYTFLFETSPTGTSLSKSTSTPSDTSFSSQDPARDGGNWYGYCGGNPVIFTDPTGKISEKEQEKQISLFTHILSFVQSWQKKIRMNETITGPQSFIVAEATISTEGLEYLKTISSEACTAGAIAVRNKYMDKKIPLSPLAIDLKNNYQDKNFYRYEDDDYRKKGQIIKERNDLFEEVNVGDILIYTNPNNPNGENLEIWTGHTATIISKGSNYVITLEFHQYGEEPSIQALSKEALQNFGDTELYGGAKWN